MSLTLVSNDDQRFEVSKETLKQSFLLTTMLDDVGDSQDPTIPLLNVSGAVLVKIIEYCHHYRHEPILTEDEVDYRRRNEIAEWDVEFLQVDQEMLLGLLIAANYLDIKRLMDACASTIGNMIKGKSPADIRTCFNVVNEFTPEEEAQIRRENEWAEDRDNDSSCRVEADSSEDIVNDFTPEGYEW